MTCTFEGIFHTRSSTTSSIHLKPSDFNRVRILWDLVFCIILHRSLAVWKKQKGDTVQFIYLNGGVKVSKVLYLGVQFHQFKHSLL